MSQQDIVKLNVGGHCYTTTRATLTRFPNSMLGVMFNGTFTTTVDENGHHFIDRDGSLFGFVLNFLRSSSLALPNDFQHFDQLCLEADFFQVQPLIQELARLKRKLTIAQNPRGSLVEVIEVRTGSTATMPTNNSRVKTIISGRREVVCSLPFVGAEEKLQHVSESEFTELECVRTGSNIRLKLGEHLQNSGWRLISSDVTSSSGYDAKSMISSLIIEHTYRDRWLFPKESEETESEVNGV